MSGFYDLDFNLADGSSQAMGDYSGKVLLIVNTASKCGFTPQFEGLESLYASLKERGLEIIGFPCNQFGKQDPGTMSEITEFCSLNYGVTFPMAEKVEVNGGGAHPVFQHLKSAAKGVLGTESVKWNFTKFLVDREGNVVKRFAPKDTPANIAAEIEKLL